MRAEGGSNLMPRIHPTAVIDSKAELAPDVEVGAFTVIQAGVRLGAGTVVREHCVFEGNTIVGENCQIGPAAYIGLAPQHLKLHGEGSYLIIGNNVIIRETASLHRATHAGIEHATRIGDNCLIMGGCHVAHDCFVDADVVMANSALLAGHCHVGCRAFLGGAVTIHQYVRVGRLAILAGNEAVSHDAPPFCAVRYGGLKGYNAIGCKRGGIPRASIFAIRKAYYCLHTHRTLPAAVAAIRKTVDPVPEVEELLEFLGTTQRGILPSVRFFHERSNSLRVSDRDLNPAEEEEV